jgi:VanZ family protein
LRKVIWIWLPVLIWAGLIFCFSTDQFSSGKTHSMIDRVLETILPFLTVGQIESVHFLIRKLGHWSEFFVFGFLVYRAAMGSGWEKPTMGVPWKTLAVVLIWALLDEFHQVFVPSRSASIKDSLLDFAGGFSAILLMGVRTRFVLRRQSASKPEVV